MLSMLVVATKNKGKLKEFQELLKDFQIEIKCLDDFGSIPEAIEDGSTFDENAYKKAIHTAKILGLPTIADDSGLVVASLKGEPGVYSARYAGENATDEENIEKLLHNIKGKENRRAYFQCVISIAVPDGPALTYEGRCDGIIIDERKGKNGFGYDPIFFFEKYKKTFAEMSKKEKSEVSHRAIALNQVKDETEQIKKWLNQRIFEKKEPKPDHNIYINNDWSM